MLDLQKPLYGNGDSRDYWGVTFDNHARGDLKMTATSGDSSLYLIIPQCNQDGDEPEGCMGVYVDDSLLARNMKFQQLPEATIVTFEARERVWDNLQFFGIVKPGSFKVSQQDYIAKLGVVPTGATFEHYRRFRAVIARETHKRLDISCCVNCAAQVLTEPSDNVQKPHVRPLSSAVSKFTDFYDRIVAESV